MRKKLTFRKELATALIVVSILPLLICSIFTTGFFRNRVERDYEEEAATSLAIVTDDLNGFLASLDSITEKLGESEDVREYLYIKDAEQKKYLYQALYDQMSDVVEYSECALYSLGGQLKYTTNEESFHTSQPISYGPIMRARENFGELAIMQNTDYATGNSDMSLVCSRVLTDGRGNAIGYLIVRVDQNGMERILKNVLGALDNIFIFDSCWNCIYTSDELTGADIAKTVKNAVIENGSIYDIGNNDRYYVKRVGEFPVYAVIEQHEIFTRGIVATMYGIAVLIALICLVVCVGVSYLLSAYLTKPVSQLTEAMHSVGEGDLDVNIVSDRRDEFGDMADNFNQMTRQLKSNVEERVAAQHELDEAHAQTMQAQLNPHFLYNTLDTIKWVAKANNVPDIATMSTGLAKILRASISGEQFITLREELDFVRNYMNIQKIRFSDRFEFIDNIPEKYYSFEIPKLILQPLVENSIVHGFADGQGGSIVLDIKEDEENITISVTDNGSGIPGDVLESINSHNKAKLNGHHGVYNVDTIIRLHYGENYGITAESENGKTVVSIKLPAMDKCEVEKSR